MNVRIETLFPGVFKTSFLLLFLILHPEVDIIGVLEPHGSVIGAITSRKQTHLKTSDYFILDLMIQHERVIRKGTRECFVSLKDVVHIVPQ